MLWTLIQKDQNKSEPHTQWCTGEKRDCQLIILIDIFENIWRMNLLVPGLKPSSHYIYASIWAKDLCYKLLVQKDRNKPEPHISWYTVEDWDCQLILLMDICKNIWWMKLLVPGLKPSFYLLFSNSSSTSYSYNLFQSSVCYFHSLPMFMQVVFGARQYIMGGFWFPLHHLIVNLK